MSKTPNYDAKVKVILEATTPGERTCSLTGQKWEMTDEEIGWYKKFNVPPSTVAPLARLKQLAGFAAGISIWWKPHAKTGQPILSFIHPDNPFQVLPDKEWFGEDYLDNFRWSVSDPFFARFRELAFSIPVGAMRDDGSSINCIGVDLLDAQDCYMTFGSGDMKRVLYAYMTGMNSEDCVDAVNTGGSRESFALNWCDGMYKCAYAFDCNACLSSAFLFGCEDCEFCFGATNKSHKKYLWFNEQLSREEWEERRSKVDLSIRSVYDAYVEKFEQLMAQAAWQQYSHVACEDSTGESLTKCARCRNCWWIIEGTDLFYCWACMEQNGGAFSVWIGRGSDGYQSCDLVYSQNCKYSVRVWRCVNMEYSMDCYECQNCFGCFGLRHKQFCIFNNQYSEEEYWMRVDDLKCTMLERGEYGAFFPGDLSQSGFQFSMGKMYFEYTPEEYKAFGAPHFDPARGAVIVPKSVSIQGSVLVTEIPDALADTDPAKFVGKPIHDPTLQRNFSVTDSEFAFYQAHQLPFPREHFLTRLKKLTRHSYTPIPFETTCYVCKKSISSYKNQLFPDRRIYCRACYLAFLEQS